MAWTLPPTTEVQIARMAKALYSAAPGKTYMDAFVSSVTSTSVDAFSNWFASTVSSDAATLASTVVTNIGLTGTAATDATAYLTAAMAADSSNMGKVINDTMNLFAGMTADTTYGTAASAFNDSVATSYAYSMNAANTTVDLTTLMAADDTTVLTLTDGLDNLPGTTGDDTFIARIVDNNNTLESGDVLTGGAGTDTLDADMGNSSAFAVTPETTGIETVRIRAEADDGDAADNNTQAQLAVHIDAQNMEGVTTWESSNSRGDLIIEDVRVNSNVSTIAFVESDPGDVDYGVYFNQRNLVNSTGGTSSLNLQIMDTVSAAAGTAPLLNSTYGSFTFTATQDSTDTVVTLTSDAIQDAQTYAEMVTAFQAALDAQFGAGAATAALGDNFTVVDPASGTSVTGQSVVLSTASPSITFTTPTGSGWTSTGTAPAASNFYTNWSTGGSSSTALVNTNIILDDVGMGSVGGDLLVGGMSTGITSSSKGVERFNIEVRDNSQLQTINSTDNTLREVVITNGTTTSSSSAYVTTTSNAGDLSVNGVVGTAAAGTTNNAPLSGSETGSVIAPHATTGATGFTDVRLIDGSAMTGKLAFTSAISTDSIAKYVTRVDTAASPTADVAVNNTTAMGANFDYKGGTNDDTISVVIDGAVTASRSSMVSGQSDFTISVDGGTGNDAITVDVAEGTVPAVLNGGIEDWANNQDMNDNITITGGAGNDTIRTPGAGDTNITAGTGNDTIYTDNTGLQTVAQMYSATGASAVGITAATTTSHARWVFNTWDQVNAVANGAARNINDLRSDANDSYNFYKGTVTVSFRGLPAAAVTLTPTSYKTTDFEINQAIKSSINNDATLSKLLIAEDGPGSTLVVTSLIDGARVAGDLTVTFAAPSATVAAAFSATEISGMATAYSNAGITTGALALAAMALPSASTQNDYASALAQDSGGTNITGANSTSTSDNFVTPGTGDDVIVLGTTEGVDLARSSNEVVTLEASFGNDVIVNFDATGNGIDHLNVGAFLTTPASTTLGAYATATDNLVTVVAEAATNDTAAEVAALITAADTGTLAAAVKQVYIVYNAAGVGSVYSIANGTAAADAVTTLQGTIDLADTSWTALSTAAHYQTVTAIAEGASTAAISALLTAVINNQALVGTTGIDAITGSTFTGVQMTGGAGADVFTSTAGSSNITDLTTGDAVVITGGAITAGASAAVGVAAFAATADTSHTVGGTFTINSLTAGSAIDMSAATATGAFGFILAGGAGNDSLIGSAANDTITTGATGTDSVAGGAGVDTITAGGGTTTIDGGLGNDNIVGGAGIDTITVSAGIDAVTAFGTAADVISVSAGAAANVTTNAAWTATASSSNAGVLNITLGAAGATNLGAMTGTVGVTVTSGGAAEQITGTPLADTITCGAGVQTIILTGGAANTDKVGSFTTTADIIHIDLSDLNALASVTQVIDLDGGALAAGVAGASVVSGDLNATDDFVTGTGDEIAQFATNFATASDLETALEVGGSEAIITNGAWAAKDAFLALYDNGVDSFLAVVASANAVADNGNFLAGSLTATNLIQFTGVADATALATVDFVVVA